MVIVAQGRIAEFSRDGYTFDVIDRGPLDGTPVVMLHGFPQRATSWSRVTDILTADGFRVLAPDQRGYSPRARPSKRSAYRMRELVDDVVALIDLIGRPVTLVGHDWGASVAWATATRHPVRVSSLTAVSVGHPSAFLKALRRPGQLLRAYYLNIFQLPRLPERLLSRPRGLGKRWLLSTGMDHDAYDTFQAEIVGYGALTGGLNWYRALPLSIMEPRDVVRVPTTLVWSTGDAALGRRQAELTAAYVDAPYDFVELAGVSHWIPEERPAEVAAAVARRVSSA